VGDAREVLAELPANSADCCVTSPPYWGLRDYGAAGQLGLEAHPEAYVAALVAVFAEVRRVLTSVGTLWLNLGDTYAAKARGSDLGWDKSRLSNPGYSQKAQGASLRDLGERHRGKAAGLKDKDLVGIPWRVAFALQAAGWWLRSDIVWAKPNPMPESVTDRPTKSHEYVFLLSKRKTYYYDNEASKEPSLVRSSGNHARVPRAEVAGLAGGGQQAGHVPYEGDGSGRNMRSVWDIATQPYKDAHFATFPEELPRRCITAGCPEWVCTVCCKPRERLVERQTVREHGGTREMGKTPLPVVRAGWRNGGPTSETVGWTDCGHGAYRAGVVLDPFIGSGTTALVARNQGRHAIGIELNPEYAELAAARLAQQSLLS